MGLDAPPVRGQEHLGTDAGVIRGCAYSQEDLLHEFLKYLYRHIQDLI
jgi:hypothetical protein